MGIKNIILTGTHHSGKTAVLNKFWDRPEIQCFEEMIRPLSQARQFCFLPYECDYKEVRYSCVNDTEKHIDVWEKTPKINNEGEYYYTNNSLLNYARSEAHLAKYYRASFETHSMLQSLYEDKQVFLFDRFGLDTVMYTYYFLHTTVLKEKNFSYTSINAIRQLYNATMAHITQLIKDGFFNETLILLLEPIPILKHDGFRLGEKEQTGVFEIAKMLLNYLMLDYKCVNTKQAESIINVILASKYPSKKCNSIGIEQNV